MELLTGATHGGATGATHGGSGAGTGAGPSNDAGAGVSTGMNTGVPGTNAGGSAGRTQQHWHERWSRIRWQQRW